jgi:5-methylcytosine-specific restriction endonuclease McrA
LTTTKLDEFHGLRGREIFDLMTYEGYLKTEHWKDARADAIYRADYKCQLCSEKDRQLQVHHNNYECLGNEGYSDMIALCDQCHARHHGKLKDHTTHTGAICPECGAELAIEVRVMRMEK